MKKNLYLILIACLTSLYSIAQIPNGGFESWTNMGTYFNPDSWQTLNDVTAIGSVFTCVKGTPGVSSSVYLKLTSKSVAGMGVMPGVAVCGTVDMITLKPTSGFPCTVRPMEFSGDWQYMAYGNDQGYVAAVLTKWNATTYKRDTVAYCMENLIGMAMSWANFSIPFTYMSGDYPDSAIVVLSASGSTPVVNSYIYADNLAFTGTVAGISSSEITSAISVFPNPVSNQLMLDLSHVKTKVFFAEISDLNGKSVMNEKIESNNLSFFEIGSLPKGNYLIRFHTDSGIVTKSFIKQ